MRKPRHLPGVTLLVGGEFEPRHSDSHTVVFNIIVTNKNNRKDFSASPTTVEEIAHPQIPLKSL